MKKLKNVISLVMCIFYLSLTSVATFASVSLEKNHSMMKREINDLLFNIIPGLITEERTQPTGRWTVEGLRYGIPVMNQVCIGWLNTPIRQQSGKSLLS